MINVAKDFIKQVIFIMFALIGLVIGLLTITLSPIGGIIQFLTLTMTAILTALGVAAIFKGIKERYVELSFIGFGWVLIGIGTLNMFFPEPIELLSTMLWGGILLEIIFLGYVTTLILINFKRNL